MPKTLSRTRRFAPSARATLAAVLATGGLVSLPALAETKLTFGMQDADSHNVHQGVVAANEKLQELSDGEMSLQIFPSSQLGDFKAMVAQVQAGELDLVMTGYPDMSYIIPELKLIGEPYVVSDYDHLLTILDGPFGEAMDEKFAEQDIDVLDVWYYGTRQTTSNKPIESIEDMQGLRLRTPNVPFLIDYAEAAGASPAPVAFAEVYLALQTNQVDAQENPLPTIESMKFHEVQSHIAMTDHFVASAAVQASAKTLENLSEEQRGWLQEAIETGGEASNQLMFDSEEQLVSFFEGEGLTVTRPDTAPFREAMQPYYDKLEAEFGEGSITDLIETK